MINYGKYLYSNNEYLYLADMLDNVLKNKDFNPNVKYLVDFIPSDVDFSVEPNETLEELYRQRAQQLRDKYNYLILMYSGGADSHEMLMSFLNNNIYLDEVRTYTAKILSDRMDYTPPQDHPLGLLFEHQLAAVPGMRLVETLSPRTKLVIRDYSNAFKTLNEEWLDTTKKIYNIHGGLYMPYREVYQAHDLQDYAERHNLENVGVLFGTEKPRFRIRNNKLYACYGDHQRDGGFTLIGNSDATRLTPEMFYWGEVRITQKQCHVLRRVFVFDPELRKEYEASTDFYANCKIYKKLHKYIYPNLRNCWQRIDKANNEELTNFLAGSKARSIIDLKNSYFNRRYGKIAGSRRLDFGSKNIFFFDTEFFVGDLT